MKTQPNPTRKPLKLYVDCYKLIELTTSDPSQPIFKVYHRADPRQYLGRIQLSRFQALTFLRRSTSPAQRNEIKSHILSEINTHTLMQLITIINLTLPSV